MYTVRCATLDPLSYHESGLTERLCQNHCNVAGLHSPDMLRNDDDVVWDGAEVFRQRDSSPHLQIPWTLSGAPPDHHFSQEAFPARDDVAFAAAQAACPVAERRDRAAKAGYAKSRLAALIFIGAPDTARSTRQRLTRGEVHCVRVVLFDLLCKYRDVRRIRALAFQHRSADLRHINAASLPEVFRPFPTSLGPLRRLAR